jgi:CheY-like chemotaxis protein
LVEDNPADAHLAEEALKDVASEVHVHLARNGVEALDVLRREGESRAQPRPDIVLLDLKMPKMDGFELLGRVKGDPELKRIPVIVLSSSRAESDIKRAYDLYANCYVVKPIDLDEFITCLELILEFWVGRAELCVE